MKKCKEYVNEWINEWMYECMINVLNKDEYYDDDEHDECDDDDNGDIFMAIYNNTSTSLCIHNIYVCMYVCIYVCISSKAGQQFSS